MLEGGPILQSTLICPECGTAKTETMPTDACQYFYDCTGCGVVLRPKVGDCCVFCSYGDSACPPKLDAPVRRLDAEDADGLEK
jgi:hypothetical protein